MDRSECPISDEPCRQVPASLSLSQVSYVGFSSLWLQLGLGLGFYCFLICNLLLCFVTAVVFCELLLCSVICLCFLICCRGFLLVVVICTSRSLYQTLYCNVIERQISINTVFETRQSESMQNHTSSEAQTPQRAHLLSTEGIRIIYHQLRLSSVPL